MEKEVKLVEEFPGVEWVELDGQASAEGALRRCEVILAKA